MHLADIRSVCFLGDSITAAEKFTRILIDYFVVNYPQKQIQFYNMAIPGAGVPVALSDWERQVLSKSPDFVTVLFGMNDLQLSLYADSAKITDRLLAKREQAITRFLNNMEEMLARLNGIPYLLMTPTLHDESPEIEGPLYGGYDASLKKAADALKNQYAPVLDLHAILLDANQRRITKTIIGPDRVHPGNIGQALIAYHILKKSGFSNLRLPLWDPSITEEEKAILAQFDILEDARPKNPYSDARKEASRRRILFRYTEQVLHGQNIDPLDTKTVNEFLQSQAEQPIEDWRKACYMDYMENRDKQEEIFRAPDIFLEKMYIG